MTKITLNLSSAVGAPPFLPVNGAGCVYTLKKGRAHRLVVLAQPGIVWEFTGGNLVDGVNFASTFPSAVQVGRIK